MAVSTKDWAVVTVGELVVERPSRARVFERLGIDYCCGGRVLLGAAAAAKGLTAADVVVELEREAAGAGAEAAAAGEGEGERNWGTASLTDLCDHIEGTHHAYLKRELPRLDFLTEKVARAHGGYRPELVEVRRVFVELRGELEGHMVKEERVLFPLCRALDEAEALPAAHCGSVANPISVMVREHDDAGVALGRFRALTGGYVPPAEACNTYRAMLDGLLELERDMHGHVHKENNILFPKAVRVEGRLRK